METQTTSLFTSRYPQFNTSHAKFVMIEYKRRRTPADIARDFNIFFSVFEFADDNWNERGIKLIRLAEETLEHNFTRVVWD